ncbi:hybrid sensor histidine kinase/response regulator transcription factor [Aliikangiella marina]|nr:two-component regulator propeller domain-containing protein [Aliikangiella marina]
MSSNNFPSGYRVIMQDKEGFMWFGTGAGLNRYDGYKFKHFLKEPDKLNTISSDYITALWQDNEGIIWVGTQQGLNKFDPKTNQFSPFLFSNSDTIEGNQFVVKSIAGNQNGELWVGILSALYKINLQTSKVARYVFDSENPHSISDRTVSSIIVDHTGRTWIGTSNGINQYNPDVDGFKHYLTGEQLNNSIDLGINALFESKDNLIWAGTDRGLYLYDEQTDNFNLFLSKPNESSENITLDITSITQDDEGNIWLGTDSNGLCLLQLKAQDCLLFKHDKSDHNSLKSNKISDIYFDQQGRIWVASFSGLNYFYSYRPFASYIRENAENPIRKEFVDKPVTETMFDKDGALWVAFYDVGLVKYNQDGQIESTFKHDPKDKYSLGNNRVTSMLQTNDGTILVGTQGKGMHQYDPVQNNFKRFAKSPRVIITMIEDNNGDVWVGATRESLVKFNRNTNEFIKVYDRYGITSTITSLYLSSSNTLWVGHLKGITVIDFNSNSHKTYVHDPKDPKSLSYNVAVSITEDRQGHIWIGTMGGGVNKFTVDTGFFERYRKTEGLTDNTVYSVVKDNDENIWAGTQYGLSKLDPVTNTFENFYTKDGLLSNDFNMASSISKSGEIALGNYKGVQRFSPANIRAKDAQESLNFTEFKLFNKLVAVNKPIENTSFVLQQSVHKSSEINLTYKETLFSFEFAVLNSLTPKKIKYAYRLSGWDEDWIYTDHTNRIATYTNIPDGEYQLEVKSTDKSGNWREDIKSLKLTISPPFWKTKLAYFIYSFVFVLSIYLLLSIRTRALVHRAFELEKSVEHRTAELASEKEKVEQLLQRKNEEFANLSHEFRTPLTLILGPLAQLLKTNKDTKDIEQLNIIERNSYRLLRMVDQLLNLETFRVRAITQQSPQAIGSIIKQLAGAFVDFAKEKSIELQVGHIEAINFKFTHDALEKIVANLLSNAIKYTPAGGKIKIHSERTQANQLLIEISDTGVGIPEDKLEYIFERYSRVLNEKSEQVTGAGIGLALVKDLVESHGGKISIQSKEGKGTTVKVLLPIVDEVDSDQVKLSDNQEIIAMELMGITNQFSDSQEPINDNQTDSVSDKPSVLVVEDNQDMRSYITARIRKDYKVVTASNGQEGIETALTEIPDLIISDIMMPHKDGYQLTHELRQNPVTSHIPVILLTARDDKESRLKGWYEKADEYLTKPFDVEELTIRMSNLLGIRNILKKRYSELAFQKKTRAVSKKETELSLSPAPEDRNPINKLQEKFINQLNSILEKHYSEASTSVTTIANDFAMSERQFFRKLKSVVDMTPTDYLRRYRLERSRELLAAGTSVKEATFDVGFSSQSYFARCFKAQFGISPSEYAKASIQARDPSVPV